MTSLLEHLLSRGCDPAKYHCYLDEETRTATFLLYGLSGKLVGYQTYKPDGPKTRDGKGFDPKDLRYYTWVTKSETGLNDSVVVFGTECFDPKKRDLYLVEGLFDAVALHNLGLNAFAVLGNVGEFKRGRPVPLRSLLRGLSKHTVAVEDGDEAGSNLGKYTDELVKCPVGFDPGALGPDRLRELLKL